MKYLSYFLILFVFFNFSLANLSAQVVDSEYVREGTQAEVLGVEKALEEVVQEEKKGFSGNIVIDILGALGGLALIALFAYIVYSNKEDS